jgi:hypothetical protein
MDARELGASGTSLGRFAHPASTALLLLGASLLAGIRLPATGNRTLAFEAFGFVEGVLALLVLYLFVRQGTLPRPRFWFERLILAYWLFATAVLLRMALPPPGLGYWIGTAILGSVLLGVFSGNDRRRTVFSLGVALAACGVIRFGIIPFVWRNAALPDLGPLEFSGISDWAKGLVTDYEPVLAGNEILNLLGVALFACALWRVWPAREADPLAGLSSEERDRLLLMLIDSRAAGPAVPLLRSSAGRLPPPPSQIEQVRNPPAAREPGEPS